MQLRNIIDIHLCKVLVILLMGSAPQATFGQNFTLNEVANMPFAGVHQGSNAWGDFDSDGDQDLFVSGMSATGRTAKLYMNDGNGVFTEILGTPFIEVSNSSVAVSDIDGDNDIDILISGSILGGIDIKLYENDGTGNFTVVAGTPFAGVVNGDIKFADIDNDNDQDVLITGLISGGGRISRLYSNDGSGNFTQVSGTPFSGVNYSSVAFSDTDGDSDQDLVITGFEGAGIASSKLYVNDGTGGFTEITATPFEPVYSGSIAFSDLDADNDQDLLILGASLGNGNPISKLYFNNGSGIFTENTGSFIAPLDEGHVDFEDLDNDQDFDLVITGLNTGNNEITFVYSNDGTGVFTLVSGPSMTDVYQSDVSFADINGDNLLEVLISGKTGNQQTTKLYETCIFTQGTDVQTACQEFTWIDGNTYTSSTNVPTFTLTNQQGCDSVVTLDLTINNVGDLSTSVTGLTISATNATATSYQWIDCAINTPISGETGSSFTATANGDYAVIIDNNGCSDTSDCVSISTVHLTETTQSSFNVFPNPSGVGGNVKITASENTSGQVLIRDVSGKLIDTLTLGVGETIEYKGILSKGVYLITFVGNNKQIESKRLIIQ